MDKATDIVFSIFSSFVDFLFNDAVIVEGVTIGYFMAAVFIFGVVIKSVLNLPSSLPLGSAYGEYHAQNQKAIREKEY